MNKRSIWLEFLLLWEPEACYNSTQWFNRHGSPIVAAIAYCGHWLRIFSFLDFSNSFVCIPWWVTAIGCTRRYYLNIYIKAYCVWICGIKNSWNKICPYLFDAFWYFSIYFITSFYRIFRWLQWLILFPCPLIGHNLECEKFWCPWPSK